jgi:hypothetical protein
MEEDLKGYIQGKTYTRCPQREMFSLHLKATTLSSGNTSRARWVRGLGRCPQGCRCPSNGQPVGEPAWVHLFRTRLLRPPPFSGVPPPARERARLIWPILRRGLPRPPARLRQGHPVKHQRVALPAPEPAGSRPEHPPVARGVQGHAPWPGGRTTPVAEMDAVPSHEDPRDLLRVGPT